jgi:hypothetical protein
MSQSTLTQPTEIIYLPSSLGGYNVILDEAIVGTVIKDDAQPTTHQWYATWGPNAEQAAWGPTRKAAVEQARHLYERAVHEETVAAVVASQGYYIENEQPFLNTGRTTYHLPFGHRVVVEYSLNRTGSRTGTVKVYEGSLCTLTFEHTNPEGAANSLFITLRKTLAQTVGA